MKLTVAGIRFFSNVQEGTDKVFTSIETHANSTFKLRSAVIQYRNLFAHESGLLRQAHRNDAETRQFIEEHAIETFSDLILRVSTFLLMTNHPEKDGIIYNITTL